MSAPAMSAEAGLAAPIRRARPVVHCITNTVTAGRVADALAAIGALPIMALALEESADVAARAQALLLNCGTPSAARFEAMRAAGLRARSLGIPIVLDPVGCGASTWRTRSIADLASAVRPTIVRGNAPEIATLAGLGGGGTLRGVTADLDGEAPRGVTAEPDGSSADPIVALARSAASALGGATILATGLVDVIVGPERTITHRTGVPVLRDIVGAGDVLSALAAAAAAVHADPADAADAALRLFAHAARAAREQGPGGFWSAFLDALGAAP